MYNNRGTSSFRDFRHSTMRVLSVSSSALAGLVALSACTVAPPPGPSILAQPGQGKSFQQFQIDDGKCRNYAAQANGGVTPGEAANRSGIGSAIAGTLIGAAAGALLGGGRHAGYGAAVGAGGGLLLGSAIGSGAAERSGASFQANYDRAYAQCTVASGNYIQQPPAPVFVTPAPVYVTPAPVYVAPPPPPGPPPGYGYGY